MEKQLKNMPEKLVKPVEQPKDYPKKAGVEDLVRQGGVEQEEAEEAVLRREGKIAEFPEGPDEAVSRFIRESGFNGSYEDAAREYRGLAKKARKEDGIE